MNRIRSQQRHGNKSGIPYTPFTYHSRQSKPLTYSYVMERAAISRIMVGNCKAACNCIVGVRGIETDRQVSRKVIHYLVDWNWGHIRREHKGITMFPRLILVGHQSVGADNPSKLQNINFVNIHHIGASEIKCEGVAGRSAATPFCRSSDVAIGNIDLLVES